MPNPYNPDDYERDMTTTNETMALEVVADAQTMSAAPVPAQPKPQTTSAQAKVEAVANLTFKAYERASTLVLTTDELKGLQEQFPDEAFSTGAAGKDNLIYLSHAHLRDRLNKVLGVGQWSIIPRSRWAVDSTYWNARAGKECTMSTVYVEAMLIVRGCYVSEAIGDMVYYPDNASTNYGDAVEGAKSAALRRCCKEFGVGIQAWSKEWTEGWWKRRNAPKAAPAPQPAPVKPAAAPVPKPAPAPAPVVKQMPPDLVDAPSADDGPVNPAWEKHGDMVCKVAKKDGPNYGKLIREIEPQHLRWLAEVWEPKPGADGKLKQSDIDIKEAAILYRRWKKAQKQEAE